MGSWMGLGRAVARETTDTVSDGMENEIRFTNLQGKELSFAEMNDVMNDFTMERLQFPDHFARPWGHRGRTFYER